MIIKNLQLTPDAIKVLNQLIEQDMDASAAFKLTRAIKEISSIYDDKTKMERKIAEKHMNKDETGNPVLPKDDKGNPIPDAISIKDMSAFSSEMESLMNVETNINYDPIKFEDLKLKTAKIKDLIKVEFLFK